MDVFPNEAVALGLKENGETESVKVRLAHGSGLRSTFTGGSPNVPIAFGLKEKVENKLFGSRSATFGAGLGGSLGSLPMDTIACGLKHKEDTLTAEALAKAPTAVGLNVHDDVEQFELLLDIGEEAGLARKSMEWALPRELLAFNLCLFGLNEKSRTGLLTAAGAEKHGKRGPPDELFLFGLPLWRPLVLAGIEDITGAVVDLSLHRIFRS